MTSICIGALLIWLTTILIRIVKLR